MNERRLNKKNIVRYLKKLFRYKTLDDCEDFIPFTNLFSIQTQKYIVNL